MTDLFVFALLFAAIAIGWFLGRRSTSEAVPAADFTATYSPGLDDVLDGRPDGAIDAFITGLEVNSDTVETHFALGAQLRQKGEVERAVRVHQNLLARPSLPPRHMHQAHLELARDYISAGLLDRAEQLLLDLVRDSTEQRATSQRHLLDLYEIEREWQRAVDVATALLPARSPLAGASSMSPEQPGQRMAVALAHYYCELASEEYAAANLQKTRELLHKALMQDKQCVRASIMLGEVEFDSGRYKAAVKALRRVSEQDPDFVPETIADLRKCYRALGNDTALKAYLQDCLATRPAAALVVAVAEDILSSEGIDAASKFLAAQLAEQPSLRGLGQLIGLRLDASDGNARAELELLQDLVERLLAVLPAYRCGHCGFSGRHLHWSCPGCRYWGSIKMIGDSSV